MHGKLINVSKYAYAHWEMEVKEITFRIFSVSREGPLDEKYATTGAGLYLGTSTVGRIVAVGFLL